jgi:hypothetical protein
MLPASDKSSITKRLAGINGWGTINLDLHASGPLSEVRMIFDWKGKLVTVRLLTGGDHGVYGPKTGDYKIINCNEHYITLEKAHFEGSRITEPVSQLGLKMDDEQHRLMLLFTGYR